MEKNMNTRRDFLKNAGAGAVAAMVIASGKSVYSQVADKKIRIGIIGAENSHTILYGRTFNIEKKFPGVEVLYVWGETDEFAKVAAQKGAIPNIVKDPNEMLGKIDALIVDHRHGKYHLPPALPFIKARIPVFIDKPFCYRVAEGKEFLAAAKQYGTPVSSYSTGSHNADTFDILDQVKEIKNITYIITAGPCDIESEYGGVFFYGVHTVEKLMYIFGEDITEVKITRKDPHVTAALSFASGLFATAMFIKKGYYGWPLEVITDKGLLKLESRIKSETGEQKAYEDMVTMFRTGKEPRSHESILKTVAILEALEKSIASQNWEPVVV